MKKRNIILLAFAIISIFLIGCNIIEKKFISASTLTSLSDTIEVENYSVDIRESTLYENYILTKYTVETLDKSPLPENTVTLNAILHSNNSNHKPLDNYIIKESFISDYKKEFLTINFLNTPKGYSFDVTYEVKLKDIKKQKKLYSDGKSKLKKSTNTNNGYHILNNKVNINNINIDTKSLLIKNNYSLLNFTTENGNFIQDDYIIRVKSVNFEDIFFINPIGESNSFYVPITYKDGEIDFNNLEINLVNVNTNEKALIYKSNT